MPTLSSGHKTKLLPVLPSLRYAFGVSKLHQRFPQRWQSSQLLQHKHTTFHKPLPQYAAEDAVDYPMGLPLGLPLELVL